MSTAPHVELLSPLKDLYDDWSVRLSLLLSKCRNILQKQQTLIRQQNRLHYVYYSMIANISVGNFLHLLNTWSKKLAEVCSHVHSCFYHSLVQRLLDPKLKDESLKKKSVTRSLVLSLGTVNVNDRLLFVGYLMYIMSEDSNQFQYQVHTY